MIRGYTISNGEDIIVEVVKAEASPLMHPVFHNLRLVYNQIIFYLKLTSEFYTFNWAFSFLLILRL